LLDGGEMDTAYWERSYGLGGFCATAGCGKHPLYRLSFAFDRNGKQIQVNRKRVCFHHAAIFAVANRLQLPTRFVELGDAPPTADVVAAICGPVVVGVA